MYNSSIRRERITYKTVKRTIWDVLPQKLLVMLKDNAGIKYKDINEISVFSNLSFSSLRSLYRRTKKAKRDRIKEQM
jgi:hypothetical protein